MSKIKINMLSIADKVKGQGVETAYNELVKLLNKYGKNDFDIVKNKGINYDILHMHTTDPISYIKQRLTKRVTLTYVHFLPNSLEGSIKLPKLFLKIYAWWVKKSYLKSDYLVVVNESYINEMVKLGFKKENIFYIPNLVSSDIFYHIDDKEKLRKKYKIKKDAFVVTSVGQMHKAKGIFEFIQIAQNNPEIDFIWVGDFNFGKVMEGYAQIKNVVDNHPSNLHFTGLKERYEVNEILNLSDVFFLPSYYESFSLAALEAANTEIPILLRNLDIYKNIYEDNAIYADSNTFIKEINKLKNNKMYYNKYKEKSKKIKDKYSEEKIYIKWKKLYSQIVSR